MNNIATTAMILSQEEALKLHRLSLKTKDALVQFQDVSESSYHPTYSRKDVTPEEAAELWFSKKDRKLIAKRNKILASVCCKTAPRRHSTSMNGFSLSRNTSQKSARKDKNDTSTRHWNRVEQQLLPEGDGFQWAQMQNVEPCDENAGSKRSAMGSMSFSCPSMIEEEKIAAVHDDTCRGLECLINPFYRRVVRDRKRHVKDRVFQEQSRQQQNCETSPMQLARIAREASEAARTSAYIQGQLDAAAAGHALVVVQTSPASSPTNGSVNARPSQSNHLQPVPRLLKANSCITPCTGSPTKLGATSTFESIGSPAVSPKKKVQASPIKQDRNSLHFGYRMNSRNPTISPGSSFELKEQPNTFGEKLSLKMFLEPPSPRRLSSCGSEGKIRKQTSNASATNGNKTSMRRGSCEHYRPTREFQAIFGISA